MLSEVLRWEIENKSKQQCKEFRWSLIVLLVEYFVESTQENYKEVFSFIRNYYGQELYDKFMKHWTLWEMFTFILLAEI